MPLPAATTRSGVLEVYERRPRGLSTLTELRGLDPKGFGLWRWVLDRWIPRALGVGPPGRWVRGRVTPGGSSRRRGHITGTAMARLEAPIEHSTTV